MDQIKKFLKTTIVGGLLFLVPLVLLGLVLRHALEVAAKIAAPFAAKFPAHEFAGMAIGTIVAILALVVVAFVAGLFARTAPGERMVSWLGETFLGNLPQFRVVKTMADGLTQVEQGEGLGPVMVSLDGAWQLGYALDEKLPEGWTAVFIPQAPTPMSGNVMYVPSARVRPAGMGVAAAMKMVKQLGAGSAETLRDFDFRPPRGE